MLIPNMHKVFEDFVFFDFFRFFENFIFNQKINILPPAFHTRGLILMKFTSVVQFLTLIPKIFFLYFLEFFLKIFNFFQKIEKNTKTKIFKKIYAYLESACKSALVIIFASKSIQPSPS